MTRCILSLFTVAALVGCTEAKHTLKDLQVMFIPDSKNNVVYLEKGQAPKYDDKTFNIEHVLKIKQAQYHKQVREHALNNNAVGVSSTWRTREGDLMGEVTPIYTFESGEKYCRNYQETISTTKTQYRQIGLACKRTDGTWEYVKNKKQERK
jgi:hypothetical protein